MTPLGAVIAGGQSSRMGVDKTFLRDAGGRPWWLRQVETLIEAGCAPVVLVRAPGQELPEGVECIHDLTTGIGPIAGLQAALRHAAGAPVVALAVDMDKLRCEWIDNLLLAATQGVGAAYEHARGIEALAAVYPAEALPLIETRIDKGLLGMQDLVRDLAAAGLMRLLPLPPEMQGQTRNCNVIEDLERRGLGPVT